ncbi:MAG: metal ABC transporter solute-binding protein, Zn/Mn family, partial [Candidatus Levyibacteriota bacterium]
QILVIIIFIVIIAGLVYFLGRSKTPVANANKVQIVAAENFYGDIAKQLAGDNVKIVSIISDPNTDPHEYESTVNDAKEVATAQIVIKNGDDYDTWMDKLLSASPNANRVVINEADIAKHKLPDNPHLWYGVDNVQAMANAITTALKKQDPADSAPFDSNLQKFDNSLQPIQQKMSDIKSKYNGTPVALTETIYLYQTQPMGLNVLTPLSFEQAIAEGNDPSADDVAKANDQINQKQAKVFIYNSQTVTPITTNLQNEAKKQNIPFVTVTETMPTNKHYQSWMLDQLTNLETALQSAK